MLVSMGRRRGFGDAIDDDLAGPDSALVASTNKTESSGITLTDSLLTPAWASGASSAPPINAANSTPASSSWADVGKQLVAGITSGLFRPTTPLYKPSTLGATSGISTGAIVAGVAALGVVGFLIMRRREA
jgi:hypothetical protein